METFALAAISLTIATSLLIKQRKDHLHRSYAFFCLILACERGAFFLFGITEGEFWRISHALGMAALAPLLVLFFRNLIGEHEALLSKKIFWYVFAGACCTALFFLLFMESQHPAEFVIYGFAASVLGLCFTALIRSTVGAEGARKKRLWYVLIAVVIWGLLSMSDILQQAGYAMPALSEIGATALVYLMLIIIVYPKLPELYEIMARAGIIFFLILFVAGIFYAVARAFGTLSSLPDFNLVVMASFIIVIFIDPVKLLMKRAVSHVFFDGRVAFTSLFALEDELEKEKSLFLEEMARGLAHEIRNPLGSIKGAAQYLKAGADAGESEQLLGVITEEVDRLGNVVSRFLTYANPYVINAKPHDMNMLLERAIDLIRRDHFPESIIIEKDLAPDLPHVNLDEEQFMQVIFNIILNALEAMPEGGVLTVSSALREEEGSLSVDLTIEDTGAGISKDNMRKLFKPFFTTKKGGTGLGLAICRKIVTEHGGYMNVTSQSGKGTAFHIILPVG
ncbi:MAG: ATP-binding protein [Syntrophales bacterium]|nr:ATP-binding protein [Syntrophales bacterium]